MFNTKRNFLYASIAFFSAASLLSQPKLQIVEEGKLKNDKYSWGKVKEADSPLKASIKIKNVGTDSLFVTKVKPGCGCTTAPLDKERLAPGEEATMSVELKVSGNPGPISKSITISSNDPTSPEKYMFLEAELYKPVSMTPSSYFQFPTDSEIGKQYTAKVTLTNNSDAPIILTDFTTKPEAMIVNLSGKKTLAPKESFEVIAKYSPDKTGYFNTSLQMTTNNPEQKDIIISGYGNAKESPVFNNK